MLIPTEDKLFNNNNNSHSSINNGLHSSNNSNNNCYNIGKDNNKSFSSTFQLYLWNRENNLLEWMLKKSSNIWRVETCCCLSHSGAMDSKFNFKDIQFN